MLSERLGFALHEGVFVSLTDVLLDLLIEPLVLGGTDAKLSGPLIVALIVGDKVLEAVSLHDPELVPLSEMLVVALIVGDRVLEAVALHIRLGMMVTLALALTDTVLVVALIVGD